MDVETKLQSDKLTYLCDDKRHLICIPYSIANLHRMADELGIKRGWFHMKNKKGKLRPHYDIPRLRVQEITAKCVPVKPKDILLIIKHHIT